MYKCANQSLKIDLRYGVVPTRGKSFIIIVKMPCKLKVKIY